MPMLLVSSNQTAAEQEKKQSEMETEKMWGTQVKYGTTMVQVRQLGVNYRRGGGVSIIML